jgi:hypothetical protein
VTVLSLLTATEENGNCRACAKVLAGKLIFAVKVEETLTLPGRYMLQLVTLSASPLLEALSVTAALVAVAPHVNTKGDLLLARVSGTLPYEAEDPGFTGAPMTLQPDAQEVAGTALATPVTAVIVLPLRLRGSGPHVPAPPGQLSGAVITPQISLEPAIVLHAGSVTPCANILFAVTSRHNPKISFTKKDVLVVTLRSPLPFQQTGNTR